MEDNFVFLPKSLVFLIHPFHESCHPWATSKTLFPGLHWIASTLSYLNKSYSFNEIFAMRLDDKSGQVFLQDAWRFIITHRQDPLLFRLCNVCIQKSFLLDQLNINIDINSYKPFGTYMEGFEFQDNRKDTRYRNNLQLDSKHGWDHLLQHHSLSANHHEPRQTMLNQLNKLYKKSFS